MDDIQPYKFGVSEPQAPESLSGIDRLAERTARQLRALIEPLVGVKPAVTAQRAEMVNYDLWSAMAPAFCALSTYKLHPLKGMILVRLDPAMTWALVDRFYGGAGTRPAPDRNEFTPSEERLVARLSDGVMKALIHSWADLLPMEMAPVARETDPQVLALTDTHEAMMSQSFAVQIGAQAEWTIELLYPQVALRQLEPLLATHSPDEMAHRDPLWQARLARQMGDINLPARTVLTRPTLTLAELFNLKNGDVIPVNIGGSVPLFVGNRLIAHGSIGEQNGRAAFKIETMDQGQTA
ncbi:MAG: flagellar motor switch protein FliM [Sphingobium sp.]